MRNDWKKQLSKGKEQLGKEGDKEQFGKRKVACLVKDTITT